MVVIDRDGESAYDVLMEQAGYAGRFIVVDGPDGSGKSTQVLLLKSFIEESGVQVVSVRDPGGTGVGEAIRQVLLDRGHERMTVRCETLLYMASRAQLYEEVIGPSLAAGRCVISDRWVSSTVAYQAVAGGIGAESVQRIAEVVLERCWPDLTVVLDIATEAAFGRLAREHDRMEAKGEAFHRRVREAFLWQARGRADFAVVDAADTVEAVAATVREEVERHLCVRR